MQDPAVWQFSLNTLHAVAWGGSLLVALAAFANYLRLRTLVIATTVATLGLVMLGAYVRLTDAGLGCRTGRRQFTAECRRRMRRRKFTPPRRSRPQARCRWPKAWNEMLHRYFASFVGVMIMAIAWQSWRRRRRIDPGRFVLHGLDCRLQLWAW